MFGLNAPIARCLTGCAAVALTAGCSSVGDNVRGLAESITPYRVQVVQGNFVSREQVELLKPGMTRAQVRDLLGTPLLTSIFHAERWDYVFTLRRQGVESQVRRLAVFFKGDELERFEGDPMPTESEFVAQIDNRRNVKSVPELQASEEALQKAAGRSTPAAEPAAQAPVQPAGPAAPGTYPPLEP